MTDEEIEREDQRRKRRARNRFHVAHKWKLDLMSGAFECSYCWATVTRSDLNAWAHPDMGLVTLDEIWNLLKRGYFGWRIATPHPEIVEPYLWWLDRS